MNNSDTILIKIKDNEFIISKQNLLNQPECLLTKIILNKTKHNDIIFNNNKLIINRNNQHFSYIIDILNNKILSNDIINIIKNDIEFYNINLPNNEFNNEFNNLLNNINDNIFNLKLEDLSFNNILNPSQVYTDEKIKKLPPELQEMINVEDSEIDTDILLDSD